MKKALVTGLADGTRTAQEIAAVLDCTPSYVYGACRLYGLPLKRLDPERFKKACAPFPTYDSRPMPPTISLEMARVALILRRRRQDLGLSQEALGRQIGTAQNQIKRAELLQRGWTYAFFLRWARALDMRILCVPMESRANRRQPKAA